MVFHQLVGTVRAQNVDLTTHISVLQQHDIARVRRAMSVGTCPGAENHVIWRCGEKKQCPMHFLGKSFRDI